MPLHFCWRPAPDCIVVFDGVRAKRLFVKGQPAKGSFPSQIAIRRVSEEQRSLKVLASHLDSAGGFFQDSIHVNLQTILGRAQRNQDEFTSVKNVINESVSRLVGLISSGTRTRKYEVIAALPYLKAGPALGYV